MPLLRTLKIYMKFQKGQLSKQTLDQFQARSQDFLMGEGGESKTLKKDMLFSLQYQVEKECI